MDELFEISDTQDIILSNLKHNGKQLTNTLKKRRLYTRDLAKLIGAGEDKNTPVGFISESTVERFNLFREQTALLSGVPDKDISYHGTFELLDAENTASLCRHISSELDTSALFSVRVPETSRVCYFRNRFSDLAYLAFSKHLKGATADYTHDYETACEGVYNGKYDYCILPLSSFSDGIMTRFIALMEKYELRIALSCKIPLQDEDFMYFCLLYAGEVSFEGSDRMALTVLSGDSSPLWKFLSTAELLGARCIECTSLPIKLYSERSYFTLFDISSCDRGAFSVYLQLAIPAYILDGIYKEIHQNT